MKDIFLQFFFTILAVAAVIVIKILELPVLVTIVLVAAACLLCVFAIAGGFSKKKTTENDKVDEQLKA